ncbi:Ku protein [Streptomyces cinerochromogenes]|uniref:Ku protein n=1 Tax=Streptomyces cinerochromogenes TaxID=66422 RepID=UPI00369B99BC
MRPHLPHRPRGKEYTKVYELLRAALAQANKVGIATFVMRNKQYLTALRAENKVLVLQTLHWADEVRDPGQELPELPTRRARQAAVGQEIATVGWIPSMCAPDDPSVKSASSRRSPDRSRSQTRRRGRGARTGLMA